MRRPFLILIVLSLLVSACGTFEIYIDTPAVEEPAAPPVLATAEPTLSLNSSSEEIRQAMLESTTNWLSIWMDGMVTQYAPEGSDAAPQVFHEQVWIDLSTNRFRVLLAPGDGNAETLKACDGLTILEIDLKTGRSQSRPLPEFAQINQFVPTPEPGYSYPQPLWGQIGTPLSQLAFSSDFAQSEGIFKAVATEFIADREAVVVEWIYAENELPSWRAWLDARTAVMLKMQTFGKGGAETIQSEAIINQVIYDDVFADSLFRAPASLPQFGDVTGRSSEPVGTGTAVPMGRDALGELYFFTLPRQSGQPAALVRLPGLCVASLAECPEVESLTAPFPFDFTLTPLSWSPDGNVASFAYPDDPDGTPYKLWLFDPAEETWTSLFEYAYIDPPFWSPDGEWIAFRVQDGLGGEDVYVTQRDGSGLKNLTDSSSLPEEGRPYVMDGWITGNLVMRSTKLGGDGSVYLVRVADGRARPMFETLLTTATFVPSSDGAWLAYDDYNYDSQKHTLYVTEPDGGNPAELASFTGGSLYPIVWSPDNDRLAFAYYTEFTQDVNPAADVYVIDRNGRGLKQVYRGVTIGSVSFSPDGKFLLISETASPTGGHLFVINLETLEQRIIQAPGLSLDTDWFMPSWRK